MKDTLKHIVTKNDFTAKALTNKLMANAIQNTIFDLHSIKSKNEIVSSLKNGFKLKSLSYDDIIENGFNYALDNGLIKRRDKGFDISSAQKEQINNKRNERENRIEEVIRLYFSDCSASSNDIRSWLIDSLQIFFKNYSDEWISDVTHKTTSISKVKSSLFELIKKRTNLSKKYSYLSKEDKQNLPDKFVAFINTNTPTVNSVISDFGLLAFSSSLISSATTIDNITIEAFSDCTFILDTNILFNLNLEGGSYYRYVPAINSAFKILNINPQILECTYNEYQNVLIANKDNINKTLSNYPNRPGLLKAMKDNAIVQTGLQRGCSTSNDFNTFIDNISKVYNTEEFEQIDDIHITQHKLSHDLIKLEKEIETNKETQTEYNQFFTDFTSHPKKEAALEHDVKLLKIAQALRTEKKLFILTDDNVLHRFTIEKIPKKEGYPLAIRIITFISLLALQENEEWNNDNGFDEVFSMLLRKDLFTNDRILSFDDLNFMFEHNQSIANLSDDDIIRINNEYKTKRLNEDDSDVQIFLSREIAKSNKLYYDDLTKANIELSTTKDELKRHSSRADTVSSVLTDFIKDKVIKDYKKLRNRTIMWNIIFPIVLLIILVGILTYIFIKNYDSQNNLIAYITSLIITLIGTAGWEIFQAYPKVKNITNNRQKYISTETDRRVNDALNK